MLSVACIEASICYRRVFTSSCCMNLGSCDGFCKYIHVSTSFGKTKIMLLIGVICNVIMDCIKSLDSAVQSMVARKINTMKLLW